MTIQDWSIPGADDQPIFGITHLPAAGTKPRGVLLICHGFKGYKDYGFFPRLAHDVAAQGLIAHRFNFSHSGVTHDYATFARPDLFERDTWGKQAHDLQAVAAASAAGRLPGGDHNAPPLPTVWFGHSRGGVTVLLAGARVFSNTDEGDRIKPTGVIAAAAPDTGCSLDRDQMGRLRHRGYLESPSSRTGQILRIDKAWLEEIEDNPKAFDPLACIAQVACPLLLIHGDADTTVPVDASRHLARAADGRAKLEIIPGASHTFDAPNPLPLDQEPPQATRRLIESVCRFASDQCG